MISGKELAGIEKRLDSCANIKEVVTILKKDRKFMLKTEKRIFKRFEEFSKTNPDAQLQDCLKLWYDEAITKLKLDEFNVLDDVDKISLKLSPQNALAVHAKQHAAGRSYLKTKRKILSKDAFFLTHLMKSSPNAAKRKFLTS